jgi:hypothetical protein
MSDEDDWDFAGADDAKMTIRAAIRYLLKGATGGARGDIVQEIISIARHAKTIQPPKAINPTEIAYETTVSMFDAIDPYLRSPPLRSV